MTIDALYKEFIERGTKIDCGLCDQPYGGREFDTQDIETTISGSGRSFLDRLGFVLMLKNGQRCAEPKCPLRPADIYGINNAGATNHLAKMVSDPGFIDLDHLTHRILVTHRLLLHSMKKPSLPKVRKIRHVIKTSLKRVNQQH